jgi:hypothetical protein
LQAFTAGNAEADDEEEEEEPREEESGEGEEEGEEEESDEVVYSAPQPIEKAPARKKQKKEDI